MSKLTEPDVISLLRQRHARPGNGGSGEFAFMAGVRNGSGHTTAGKTRTFDAVAISLYQSRDHVLDIFEVKVSRSDWQKELSSPAKAEAACEIADRFWIVAPAGCVKEGELPPAWGLIEITGDGELKPWRTRQVTPAQLLHPGRRRDVALDRGLVVAMLRSVPGAVPGGRLPALHESELAKARQEGYHEATHARSTSRDYELSQARGEGEHWRAVLAALHEAGWRGGAHTLIRAAADIAHLQAGHKATERVKAGRQNLIDAIELIDNIGAPPT